MRKVTGFGPAYGVDGTEIGSVHYTLEGEDPSTLAGEVTFAGPGPDGLEYFFMDLGELRSKEEIVASIENQELPPDMVAASPVRLRVYWQDGNVMLVRVE
jgi:hypothetical protein